MIKTNGITPSHSVLDSTPNEHKNNDLHRNKQEKRTQSVAIPATKQDEGIPLIPIDAMAGALTCEQTALEYECERYVVPMFKGADFLIPVKGSSMYPKYNSGDIVACKRVSMTDIFFQWNKVYVIDTDQGALIKRIKPGSAPDRILIVSDNDKYDPFGICLIPPYTRLHLSSVSFVSNKSKRPVYDPHKSPFILLFIGVSPSFRGKKHAKCPNLGQITSRYLKIEWYFGGYYRIKKRGYF